MTVPITRRLMTFGGAAVGLLPAMSAIAARTLRRSAKSTFEGVVIGCNSLTFGGMQLSDVIEGAVAAGYGALELHPRHVEPSYGPAGRPSPNMTDEERVARQAAREQLRHWRLTVPLTELAAIGDRCRAAGLDVFAFNENYRDDFTDDEIDRTFQMARALGAQAISAVGSAPLFRRLDPFAKHHRLHVGLHNEVDIHSVGEFEAQRAGLSDLIGYTLDIGHFASAGGDTMAMLVKNRSRMVNIHLRDAPRGRDIALPFGEGEAPIAQALRYARDTSMAAPFFVENPAPAPDRVALAKSSLDYCRRILETR